MMMKMKRKLLPVARSYACGVGDGLAAAGSKKTVEAEALTHAGPFIQRAD